MSMALYTEPRTRAELLALPDDGCRHELVDGVHLVAPAPLPPHQSLRRVEAWPSNTEVAQIVPDQLTWQLPVEAPLAIDVAHLFS